MGSFDDNLNEAEGRGFEEGSEDSNKPEETEEQIFEGAIMSPLIKTDDNAVGHPLVLIFSEGIMYVGGLIEATESGVLLSYPLVHMEGLVSSEVDPKQGKLQVGMRKPVAAMNLKQSLWFRHSCIAILESKNKEDLRICELYEETAKKILLGESGLATPTAEETMIISGKQ